MNFKRLFSNGVNAFPTIGGLLSCIVILLGTPSSVYADASSRPVLVELFTSEGCSSCPPADELLRKLSLQSHVVTISEHVDYWNRLGWNDPYSSKTWSDRQGDYVRNLGLSGLVTPQFIIDGYLHISGSSRIGINSLVSKAARQNPKIPLKLSCLLDKASGDLRVSVSSDRPLAENLFLHTVLVEKKLYSRVTAGENKGSFLHHVTVARAINSKRTLTSLKEMVNFKIDKSWNLRNIKVIAFIQESESKKVIAIGSTKIP